MTILSDLKRLFRRKPVEIDLTGTQAARLADASTEQAINLGAVALGDDDAVPPSLLDDRPFADAGAAQTPVAEPDGAALLRRLVERLEADAGRQAEATNGLTEMPRLVEGLTDLRRQSVTLLEAVSEKLDRDRERDEALGSVLTDLRDGAGHHASLMQHVQQHLEASAQTSGALSESIGGLRHSIGTMAESNERIAQSMDHLNASGHTRHEELLRSVGSAQRWVVAAAVTGGVAALAAAGVGIALLVTVLG